MRRRARPCHRPGPCHRPEPPAPVTNLTRVTGRAPRSWHLPDPCHRSDPQPCRWPGSCRRFDAHPCHRPGPPCVTDPGSVTSPHPSPCHRPGLCHRSSPHSCHRADSCHRPGPAAVTGAPCPLPLSAAFLLPLAPVTSLSPVTRLPLACCSHHLLALSALPAAPVTSLSPVSCPCHLPGPCPPLHAAGQMPQEAQAPVWLSHQLVQTLCFIVHNPPQSVSRQNKVLVKGWRIKKELNFRK